MNLKVVEIDLLAEALEMAASRHESMGHVTRGRFRYEHDEKANRMRALRVRLLKLRVEEMNG
jgi:hypothetical protein